MANSPRKPVKTANPGSDEISRELDLLNVLNKEGGSPAQLLGSNVLAVKIKGVISTQCPTVDAAIGRGGIPLGRLTLVHGKEGAGKSVLALHCAAEAQRVGGMVIYADAEHKLDPDFAARIGVDINRLVIIQPDHLEKFFDTIEKTIGVAKRYRAQGKSFPILVILDSINAIGTKKEMDADWDDSTFAALTAGYYSQNLKKLIPMINSEEVALLFVSQEREKIGVMFGPKSNTGGGKAPRYYASLVMEVFRKATKKDDHDIPIGIEVEVNCAKNQIAPPFRKAEFFLSFDNGIDYEDALFREGLRLKKITQTGSWFQFGEKRLGHGADNSIAAIREDKVLKEAIKRSIVCVK